ncbi:unnamed protein product, partial [Medioppia subpectinata]
SPKNQCFNDEIVVDSSSVRDKPKVSRGLECWECPRVLGQPRVYVGCPNQANQQGALVADTRYFGVFRCGKCYGKWNSASCWLGFKQQCKCGQWSDPSHMRPLKPSEYQARGSHGIHAVDKCQKCQSLGRDCSRND